MPLTDDSASRRAQFVARYQTLCEECGYQIAVEGAGTLAILPYAGPVIDPSSLPLVIQGEAHAVLTPGVRALPG